MKYLNRTDYYKHFYKYFNIWFRPSPSEMGSNLENTVHAGEMDCPIFIKIKTGQSAKVDNQEVDGPHDENWAVF